MTMTTATHKDIVRLLPGIQDHTVLEILERKPTVDELEAVLLLLQDDDEDLVDLKRQPGDRLNLLLEVLENSEIQDRDDFEP